MAIVKAPVFTLEDEMFFDASPRGEGASDLAASNAQDEPELSGAPQPEVKAPKISKDGKVKLSEGFLNKETDNFLEKIANETFGARRRANVLRSNGRLMAACATSQIAPERIVEMTGRLAIEAMSEMGFDVNEPTALMEGAGPIFVRAATDVMSRLSRQGLDEITLAQSARRAIKAMLSVSRNSTIARFAQNTWPDDLDAKTAMKLSMTNVMSSLAVEVESFSFMLPKEKALKQANGAISKAFVKHAQGYFEADVSRPSRIMLMQSLMSNAADLYLACWQEEKAVVMPKIAKAAPRVGNNPELKAQLEAYVQLRMDRIEARFSERFDQVVKNTVDETDQLFETLFDSAKRRSTQKNTPVTV